MLGHFGTGVTIVTALHDGEPVGMACNAFASVSLEPPLVLFCVDLRAPSLDGLIRSKHFAINVLASDQEEIARRFARRAEDKFAEGEQRIRELAKERGRRALPRLLREAEPVFACRGYFAHDVKPGRRRGRCVS